jgi:hypothetical protein
MPGFLQEKWVAYKPLSKEWLQGLNQITTTGFKDIGLLNLQIVPGLTT